MLIPILRQLLISAATLLTVTGSISVFYGADRPSATLFAEAEDAEEDDREDSMAAVSEPVVETLLDISILADSSAVADAPMVCLPPHERGPPIVCF